MVLWRISKVVEACSAAIQIKLAKIAAVVTKSGDFYWSSDQAGSVVSKAGDGSLVPARPQGNRREHQKP